MYYYQQMLVLVQINLLLAIASYLPFSSGLLVMDMGVSFGIGAITAAVLVVKCSLPLLVAVFVGGLAGACAALVTAGLCRNLTGFLFAISTLAIGELCRVVVTNSEALGGALGYRNVRVVATIFPLALVMLCTVVFLIYFERSVVRKALRLIRDNEDLATTVGISVSKHRLIAITAGGFWAGLAGSFYIHNFGIVEPRIFGFEFSLVIVMYAIIGGGRLFVGPFMAALVLTMVPEMLRFSSSLRMMLYGAALVAVMIFRPTGIMSVSTERNSRILLLRW